MSYLQAYYYQNWNDVKGNPGGGVGSSRGVTISWQNGTIPENGENGVSAETVIALVIRRNGVLSRK